MIAGGEKAILSSGGVEDNIIDVCRVGKEIEVSKNDILIALAASGNTPLSDKILKEKSYYNCSFNNKNGIF